jgi:hypothetical protein
MAHGIVENECVVNISSWPVSVLKQAIEVEVTYKKPIVFFLNSMPSKPRDEL